MFGTIAMVLGWIGMASLLAAYAMRERIGKRTYGTLNLVGAIFTCIVCAATETWPPFALNVVWGGIAIKDLIVASKKKSSH